MNFFKKVFGFIKGLFTRPGLDKFLSKYIEVGMEVVSRLAFVNNNADFHVWKDEAWAEVQRITGEVRGNWIAILVALAFEQLKAKQESR